MSEAPTQRILVVDDDGAVTDYLCERLTAFGYRAVGTTSALDALARIEREHFDLVVSDVEMPELRGVELLEEVLRVKPTQLVLLITAYGSVEMAVAAVRAGACDFLTKPFKADALRRAVERALSQPTFKRDVVRLELTRPRSEPPRNVVAESAAMRAVLEQARKAARSRAPVLITGETGTGKSVLARFVHEQSPRADKPFVQLNCAALPPALAESELFGVRRGAFTDAREPREGLFVSAAGGTLFLDEVGELPLEVQAKLLHVLESGLVRPLGGTRDIPTQTRVITATNRAPEALLRDGAFRPDLYYRINVVRIEVPPLRERPDDILPLVDVLFTQARARSERPIVGLSTAAVRRLAAYTWPGNVRELANVIERAVAMADHDVILPEDLVFPEGSLADESQVGVDPHELAVDGRSLAEVERDHVRRVVTAQGGNKAAAARVLGITRRTLYRKLGES